MWEHFSKEDRLFVNPYIGRINEHKRYIMADKEIINEYKGRWNQYFKNDNEIFLEIGSGAGNFAAKNGVKYPERNHIGMEIRFKRLFLAASKAEKRNLDNVVFMRRFGEEIKEIFGADEISGLYINFPDPWVKKRQKKNRIFKRDLFENLNSVMKKGGRVFFKTDHYDYYLDVLELMKEIDGYKVSFFTDDLYASEKNQDNLSTEFEDLFIMKGMKINYIEIVKEV